MLFDFDIDIVVPNLVAPVKRLPKYLAWLKSLATPIQQAWQFLFVDYKVGATYADFDVMATYAIGNCVIWTDKSVYTASYVNALGLAETFNGVYPNNTVFWTKINDNFIGIDERIKYNSQKLLFEYALNRFFRITGIYITNNFVTPTNVFVMGDSSASSSYMGDNSIYQSNYMNDVPVYNPDIYDYTIFFPIAYYTALGADADLIIKSFADIYNLAGMQYNVLTYP